MKSIVFALLICTGLVFSSCGTDEPTNLHNNNNATVDTLQSVPPDTSAHLEPRERAAHGDLKDTPEVKN